MSKDAKITTPVFNTPVWETISHFPTGEACELFSVDEFYNPTGKDLERVAQVCRHKIIYDRLFKERFKGEPYTKEKAKEFIDWGKEGWAKRRWFLFLVRNLRGQISCSVDIKSADLEGAKIGYWASDDSPGIVTSAVIQVCKIARKAGYKRLVALIASDNERSARVVGRAGFINAGVVEEEGKKHLRFQKVF